MNVEIQTSHSTGTGGARVIPFRTRSGREAGPGPDDTPTVQHDIVDLAKQPLVLARLHAMLTR